MPFFVPRSMLPGPGSKYVISPMPKNRRLLNDGGFDQERGKEFRKHLEKVADQVFRYPPTAEEVAVMPRSVGAV